MDFVRVFFFLSKAQKNEIEKKKKREKNFLQKKKKKRQREK
jgi:hypothetical protein